MLARATLQDDSNAREPVEARLSELVAYCLDEDSLPPPGYSAQELHALRNQYRSAGLDAVRAAIANDGWVQLSVRPNPALQAKLYGRLSDHFERANRETANAFFMHKEPGIRFRMQSRSTDVTALRSDLLRCAQKWRDEELIFDFRHEHYEPEQGLFGGPKAMFHVHALFTADSRFWLAQHAQAPSRSDILIMSLVLLRALFAAMRIIDWEDVDVWERIRARLGRAVPEAMPEDVARDELRSSLEEIWNAPARWENELEPVARESLQVAHRSFVEHAPKWCAALSGEKFPSPRAAAALYTIFFLNRAGVSLERQQLIADALARRSIAD